MTESYQTRTSKIIASGRVPPDHGVRLLVKRERQRQDPLCAIFVDGVFAGVVDDGGACLYVSPEFNPITVERFATTAGSRWDP